jgi:NitT/TauT family transport system substrate-binding protein
MPYLDPHDMRRRQLLRCIALGAVVPALGACSPPESVLRVGSIVFPGYEFMFLARDMGLLDERRVRMVELLANTDTLRALAAGQIEAAALTMDELVSARNDGVDLRAVLIYDVSAGADAVLAHAPVTLSTLANKRIGVEDSAVGAVMLSALLKAAGLSPDQVQKVPVTLDRTEEVFRRGAIDVVVTTEPWASRLEKSGALRLFDSSAIAGRIVDVLAVRAQALETHANALRYLIAGHFAAQALLRTDPQKAAAWMAPRLQTAAADVPSLFRRLQLPGVEQNRLMMRAGGVLDHAGQLLHTHADLRTVIDNRFLPE